MVTNFWNVESANGGVLSGAMRDADWNDVGHSRHFHDESFGVGQTCNNRNALSI